MVSTTAALLVLPQWQGYAADDRPRRGAQAIAAALGASPRAHAVAVPAWHPLDERGATMGSGEENGRRGLDARSETMGSGEENGRRGLDERSETMAGQGRVLGLCEIVAQATAALRWLEAVVPARLLVIGGDCGSDFAPIAWQAARHGPTLGVLYLDAHGDLNTPASSPSSRFHGMVLRSVLGEAPPALQALCARPLTAAQLVMAGTRDLDPAEHAYLAAAAIRPWSSTAIADGTVLAALHAHPATRWHVHLDLDVLDPTDFPEVTVPTPGGPSLVAVTALLVELVRSREVVGLTITEHVGGDASARRVADLVAALHRAGWRG